MHAQPIIPTFLTSNIYIGLWLPIALTLILLQSYKMFDILQILITSKSMGLWGILNFQLLRHPFPYQLARRIPVKEGVP